MVARFFLKTIIIFLLGCFAMQNARANLLFMSEWNFDESKKFHGNIVKIEEYIKNKLVTTYIFNDKSQLIETQFIKDDKPYSFRYYYTDTGKLEIIELFNRKDKIIDASEKAIFNGNEEIIAFHGFKEDKLITKTSAVMINEAKKISMIVAQDDKNKISEFAFQYHPNGKLKQVNYSFDGKILNIVVYSYSDNNILLKRFNQNFKLKDTINEKLEFDSGNNWIKKIIKTNDTQTEITRKIIYKKDKKKKFFGFF